MTVNQQELEAVRFIAKKNPGDNDILGRFCSRINKYENPVIIKSEKETLKGKIAYMKNT